MHEDAAELQELLAEVCTRLVAQRAGREDRPRAARASADGYGAERVLPHEYLTPRQLEADADVELPEHAPRDAEEARARVLRGVDLALARSVRTSSPLFLNRLYCGAEPVGVAAECVIAALNTSPDTYSVAPLISLVQQKLLARVATLFRLPRSVDATFCPGGSYANLLALLAARHRSDPDAQKAGVGGCVKRMLVLTSAQAHYSVARAAMVLGIGESNAIRVPCDNTGAMDPAQLRSALALYHLASSNCKVIAVCATVGTTVLGAIDPLADISAVCAEYDVWLHVDACYGGSLIMSDLLRDKLECIERANSIAWNAHKLLGVPLQCSVLLVRHTDALRGAISSRSAEYLYHDDPDERELDSGDLSLQCGRRADVLKLWLAWLRFGRAGFAARVEHAMALAKICAKQLRARGTPFVLLAEPETTNVCFWVTSALARCHALRHDPDGEPCALARACAGADTQPVLSAVDDARKPGESILVCKREAGQCALCGVMERRTRVLYRAMQEDGVMLINYSSLPEFNAPAFFRLAFNSSRTSVAHVVLILNKFVELSRALDEREALSADTAT